jgi:hypothetical protein
MFGGRGARQADPAAVGGPRSFVSCSPDPGRTPLLLDGVIDISTLRPKSKSGGPDLWADSFSPFSYGSLNKVLDSSGKITRVAFLPNESYAGRADNVLHTVIIPSSPTHPPGSPHPGTSLAGAPASGGRLSWLFGRLEPREEVVRSLPSRVAAGRIRGSFKEAK